MFFRKGNQTSSCLQCQKLEEALGAVKTEMEQIKLKHSDEKEKLKKGNAGLDPVQVSELERVIENQREEKEKIESTLHSDIKKVEKELHDHKKRLVKVQRKNDRLTKENGELKKMIKKDTSKIKTEKCETSECDESKVELNRRHPSEIERLRNDNEILKKKNVDSLRKITDQEEEINALETSNKNLSLQIKNVKCETSECDKLKAELSRLSSETERLRKEKANANVASVQKIEDLETKIKGLEIEKNRDQSKIKTKESQIERLQMEANKSIEREEDLEKKTKALETKNKKLRTKLENKEHENCKMVDEEVKKYKNAVNRKYCLRNRKHFPCLCHTSYSKTSGSLGEQERLWEHEPISRQVFHSFFEFSQTFTSVSLTL